MAVCELCSNMKGKIWHFSPIIGSFFFIYNGNAVIVFVMIMSRNDIEFDSSFTLQSAATSQTLVGKVKVL